MASIRTAAANMAMLQDTSEQAGKSGTALDEFGSIETESLENTGITLNSEPGLDPIKALSGSIDVRIRLLSYSSALTLHACPRKYQLYKLRAAKATEPEDQTITFSYGQVVGEGIQLVLQGAPLSKILFRMFTMWRAPLNARHIKHKKSFAEAVLSVKKFIALRKAGFLDDLELVYTDGIPACELGFSVSIFDGFICHGFVDAVLRNKLTGDIIVLEVKTTHDRESNPAKFKNSAQAIGYSIVLDSLFPGLSAYSVLYLVYSTSTLEFTPLPFTKSFESRAEWIRSLVFDVETIIKYEEAGFYPRYGESCFSFFRPCDYLDTCGFSTAYLVKPLEESQAQIDADESRYQFKFNLVDLINTQISRNAEVIGE